MNYIKAYFDEVKESANGFVKFVMSTSEVDRMADTIDQRGWDLSNFNKSPIALWNHDHNQPIGKWHNVKVENGKLTGEIEFMPEEINEFAASVGKMVKAGFLKACSVGFRPLDMKPNKSGGLEFIKNELLECSVVSVPANASALSFAKSFANEDELRRLFTAPDSAQTRIRQAQARHRKNLLNYM